MPARLPPHSHSISSPLRCCGVSDHELTLACISFAPSPNPHPPIPASGCDRDYDGEKGAPPALTFSIEAVADVTITPQIEIGLTGEALNIASAEAAVKAELSLKGETSYQYKIGVGGRQEDRALDAMTVSDTCAMMNHDPESDDWGASCCKTSGVPYCSNKDVCASPHHSQFDVNFYFSMIAHMKLHASADFGPWDKEFDRERWFTPNGMEEEEANFKDINFHVFSRCDGKATGHQSMSG